MSLQKLICDPKLYLFFGRCDEEQAAQVKAGGCRICGRVLHSAFFGRKPRGGPEVGDAATRRCSFCCAEDGCRTRHTPASLRFLGRRVYLGMVVVLVAAMRHGATPARMRKLREQLGVSRRTVERWRKWWRESFVESAFWRAASSGFMPPVEASLVPASVLERFSGDEESRLLGFLRFVGPVTGGGGIARVC